LSPLKIYYYDQNYNFGSNYNFRSNDIVSDQDKSGRLKGMVTANRTKVLDPSINTHWEIAVAYYDDYGRLI